MKTESMVQGGQGAHHWHSIPRWMAKERPCRRNCKERAHQTLPWSCAPAPRQYKWPQAQNTPEVSTAIHGPGGSGDWSWSWVLAFSALLATNPASGCKGHVGWDYIKTLCIQYYTIIHIIAFCHSKVSGRL